MNTKITIRTRFDNGDNLKIEQFAEGYIKSGTIMCIESKDLGHSEIVLVTTIIKHSDAKNFERDLNLLNIMGIEGAIMV